MSELEQNVKVELTQFINCKENEELSYQYIVEHNNGESSLEQLLTIKGNKGLMHPSWTAEIKLDDFPMQKTPQDAAYKLADWLERLAKAIKAGKYHDFETAKFMKLKDA